MLRIAELFQSDQGEGEFAGTPTVFVRTTGCNLRCWFCDTRYTSWNPEGEQKRWQDVLTDVLRFDCQHVDLTGGEPFLQPDVVPLTNALTEAGRFVTVETAGTVFRPVRADLMSISPKLANSTPKSGIWAERHQRLRDNADVIRQLCNVYRYQLKFVVDNPADIDGIDQWLGRFPKISPEHVWLMPQAVTAEEVTDKSPWLNRLAAQHGFRVSPRLHIERYGNVRGK